MLQLGPLSSAISMAKKKSNKNCIQKKLKKGPVSIENICPWQEDHPQR